MTVPIPDGLTRADLLRAAREIGAGVPHRFGGSTRYDVVIEGRRYPPKAVLGIELVDGAALERLVRAVRADARPVADDPSGAGDVPPSPSTFAPPGNTGVGPTSSPAFSRCRAPMTRRTARRGPNAGVAFLGCTPFPDCRAKRPLA